MLTIAFLEQLETVLRQQHQNPKLVLSDYFDLIGGTSVGAILATQLALGEEVAAIKATFQKLCRSIFKRPPIWREPKRYIPFVGPYLVPRFDARRLEKALKRKLKDLRLGSPELRTGLCIITKRVDTGSPWVLTNNPRSKFWRSRTDRVIANKDYRLVDVVRASAAAPHFFRPHWIRISADKKERPGLFVDGAVSPFNNPALQMVMLAGIKGYGLDWPLSVDDLLLISIGTGSYRQRSSGAGISAWQAVEALEGIISDNEALSLTLLQWMSASQNHWRVNSDIGDLSGEFFGGQRRPLLRFERYDAPLESTWLDQQLGCRIVGEELDFLRDFTRPRNLDQLYDIGRAAAVKQITPSHFPDTFMIGTASA
jgi:hypothetical protein